VEGNCTNANKTIVSINTTHEGKQTTKRDKHKKTHNAKQLLLKKMGPKHDLGPLYRAIA
jgi:hypothetical protein